MSAARPPSGKREMPNRAGPRAARAPSAGGAISISRAPVRKRTAPAVPVHTTTQAAVDTVEGHLAACLIHRNTENIQRDGKQLEIEMQGLKDCNFLLRREFFTVRDAVGFEFKTSSNSELKTAVGMMQAELFQQADLKLASLEVKVLAYRRVRWHPQSARAKWHST